MTGNRLLAIGQRTRNPLHGRRPPGTTSVWRILESIAVLNWHTTALDHEAADLKRREALKDSPAYWSRKIDDAADGTRPTVTEEDRRAADEFILAEKLAAIQRALDQDEQKRWEQQMATLALNQVPSGSTRGCGR